jgi:hypothetical protein
MDWRGAIRNFLDSVSGITDQPLEFKSTSLDSDDMMAAEAEMDTLRAEVDELTEEVCC